MSKLFDTLEQIRKNEAPQSSGLEGVTVSRLKKKRSTTRIASIILIPALLGVGIYFSLPYLSSFFQQDFTEVAQQEQSKSPTKQSPQATIKPSAPPKSKVASVPKQTKPAPKTLAKKSTPVVAPVKPTRPKQTSTTLQQFVSYNNKGANLISNEQYWEGISYLNKAARLQPNRPEPLINMGVALSELGLYGPASRYLRKALEIDPNQQKAIENIHLLTEAGLLDMAL